MTWMESFHGAYVHKRRVEIISRTMAQRLTPNARVLDIGCGDGWISSLIARKRLDLRVLGIDVLLRPETHIEVAQFDGKSVPFPDNSFDAVIFIDVLHHVENPLLLLKEATRVATGQIVIKDHIAETPMHHKILRYMDRVGNERHGVGLPFNYWSSKQWRKAYETVGIEPVEFDQSLKIYPWWADWLFGGKLQYVADLRVRIPPGHSKH